MTMTADNNNEQPLAAAAVAAVTAAVAPTPTPTPTAVVADVDSDNETPGITTTTEDDNNNNAEEHIPLITMSKHLSNQLISPLLDPDLDVSVKIEKAEKLKPFLDEIDGYWSFSSEEEEDDSDNNSDRRHSRRGGPKVAITEGHLPILEWNTNFRKSYTILLWVRPTIGSTERKEDTTTTTIAEDDELLKNKNTSKNNQRRILYRFANHENDSQSKSGVCVSVGDWRAIVEDGDEESSTIDLSQKKKKKKNRKLITTLTAYSLPYEIPDMEKIMAGGGLDSAEFDPAPFVTAPLELIENEWSFIGITHVFPYLKRPHWTICVNGKTTASGELAYPQLGGVGNRESSSSSSVMNYNTLFSNITDGGCEIIKTNQTDCNKKASDLQQNIYNNVNPKYNLTLQLASFCVCNEVFTPTIQALLAQAGPIMSIQSYGSLPQLPPVANWSKGSSLEGPNVGIPLVVHGQSLRVQQLSASCVFWGSAIESKLMYGGGQGSNQQRIVCRMVVQKGTTHSAPRVGLIQPTPPQQAQQQNNSHSQQSSSNAGGGGWGTDIQEEDDMDADPISMTVVGNGCSIHHNLSNYLITNNVTEIDTHDLVDSTTKFLSLLLLQGQSLDSSMVLPFFLSLPPPGTIYDLQLDTLLTKSLQHLFDLFSNNAKYGASLIHLLSSSIRQGGGRWHEELLQNGTIHILVSSLRQSLVRAEYLNVANYKTYNDFLNAQAAAAAASASASASSGGGLDGGRGSSSSHGRDTTSNATTPTSTTTNNPMTTTMSELSISSTKIPILIVDAMIDLLDACCGGVSNNNSDLEDNVGEDVVSSSYYIEDLYPSIQIQRTSDLALSAVFGMALDWDLWGSDLRGLSLILKALSKRYGGCCITSGYILRSQISVQYFLDTLKPSSSAGSSSGSSGTSSSAGNDEHQQQQQQQQCIRSISISCGQILKSMLLSSLSNPRSISQGEHDISACLAALSDCPLGSLQSNVILYSLMGILEWCEIVPNNFIFDNMNNNTTNNDDSSSDDEDDDETDEDNISGGGGGSAAGKSHLRLDRTVSGGSAASTSSSYKNRSNLNNNRRVDDDHKCQVASRLARNLMMGQFHDVIAPMLLSRTIFSGYSNNNNSTSTAVDDGCNLNYTNSSTHSVRSSTNNTGGNTTGSSSKNKNKNSTTASSNNMLPSISWQEDWRLVLMIFVWITSIAGPEGIITSKSLGSLLLASGLAGSLEGVIQNISAAAAGSSSSSSYLMNLFLPDPSMALTVASTLRSSSDGWSYSDLLSDRLAIMISIFPALVISLFNNRSDEDNTGNGDGDGITIQHSERSLRVLTELITTLGGTFYRVFGGLTYSATTTTGSNRNNNRSLSSSEGLVDSIETNSAKTYVPHLLLVVMILEKEIATIRHQQHQHQQDDPSATTMTILRAPTMVQKGADDGSWVEVSSTVNASSFSDGAVTMPKLSKTDVAKQNETILSILDSCQTSLLTTVSELMCNAMKVGGGEASTLLWRNVLGTLKEIESYYGGGAVDSSSISTAATAASVGSANKEEYDPSTKNVLCRILAMVLMKCLKRDYQWELWTQPLSSAISRLCLLIEEKELLVFPLIISDGTINNKRYSNDQILLMCSLLHVCSYGRDTTGWCQLILPTPPVVSDDADHDTGSNNFSSILPFSHERSGNRGAESTAAAAKIMLPILQPTLRVMLECVGNVRSGRLIGIPKSYPFGGGGGGRNNYGAGTNDDQPEPVDLLEYISKELRHSLMAAVVGLAFATARDIALGAMATLRRAIQSYKNSNDSKGVELCTSLLCMTAEEIRVRYDSENRRRDTALLDAYNEGDQDNNDSSQQKHKDSAASESAAADSHAIENLILGDTIVPSSSMSMGINSRNSSEEISFGSPSSTKEIGADFLLFHEGLTAGGTSSTINRAKMEWSKYEGLCTALETCSAMDGGITPIDHKSKDLNTSADVVLTTLEPFLNAWDEYAAIDAVDTELVKLFDFNLNSISSSDDNSSRGSGVVEITSPELELFRFQGSECAADAMSTFIELAAAEKSRMIEVTGIFLPNHRSSCAAFTDRFCWSRYMEMLRNSNVDDLWERGISDGNRDARSRLVSIPCSPQFRRFIPKYLDHGPDDKTDETAVKDRNNNNNEANDIDAFTQLLIKSGHLEIVDITKKEINIEEEPALELPTSDTLDDDFDEKPLEISTPRTEDDAAALSEKSKKIENDTATDETTADDKFSKDENDGSETFDKTKIGSAHYNITASAFASPPDNSSSTLGLMHSAAAGLIERHVEDCLHVKTEGSRKCSLLLTSTHLILEYDVDSEGLYEGELMSVREEAERQRMIEESRGGVVDEEKIHDDIVNRQKMMAALRPKSIRWSLSELSHVYLRRYRLRDSSIELFFIPSGGTSFGGYGLYSPSTSLFIDFGPGYEGNTRRDDAAFAIMKRAPPQAIKQWPDRSPQFMHEQLSRLTIGWVEGRITNFDYLLHLNMLAGRSYNDTCQYPIMPWVLSNYHSEEIPDLTDPSNFRDLTKPMGALNPSRLEDFIERFNTFADPSIPPFMYGSHYSTNAGVVLHFLVRLHPFAGLHRQLQGGNFDVADRLFSSVPRTWEMCTGSSAAEVKELTPEWYCAPSFLKNGNKFKLGTSQDGDIIGDVALPPWAKGSPEKFIEVMRSALESDICSAMLPDWIDLLFGRKQQGPEAIAAHNVFFYLTYYGSVDVAAIEDEGLRHATELQIAHFGQCPMQLFVRPHVRRVQYVNKKRLSFYQITSAYTFGIDCRSGNQDESFDYSSQNNKIFGQPLYLPFFSAPISHWVHLDAPPPGPHAPLISVRLAGTDRCLAVDKRGVFHCFRWAWKAEESTEISGFGSDTKFPLDNGCFIAQRELTRFRTVPRLVHKPQRDEFPAIAISKTLFAGRSVLLVLSDGDGRGGLAMQLVDPSKGVVRGEAVIKSVHSARIQCIATDPIGTAAGHGGVGGELAIVGSSDGSASIWRFMSSHYLPLRPRVRFSGHCCSPIHAVGLNAAINIAVTVSENRLCLHSIGNGNVIRTIEPPKDALDLPKGIEMTTTFAKSPAVAISVQGFVVAVCETRLKTNATRSVITLQLFSLEGVSLGSKALESWRGVPNKIVSTPDGTTILVCSGRGVTVHRLSAITPLEYIDEWQVTESEELSSDVSRAFDIDLGPSLNRPIVAAVACSNGVLRLHALAGISAFSERHKKVGLTQSVGSLMAAPARRFKNVFGKASAIGNMAADVGKDISKEISTDVKERGVTGFLGGMFGKKK